MSPEFAISGEVAQRLSITASLPKMVRVRPSNQSASGVDDDRTGRCTTEAGEDGSSREACSGKTSPRRGSPSLIYVHPSLVDRLGAGSLRARLNHCVRLSAERCLP